MVRASYGATIVKVLEKTDRVITAPHQLMETDDVRKSTNYIMIGLANV